MFNSILKKLSQSTDTHFAGRVFDWLTVAKRPLTLEELRQAVAINPLKADLDAASLVNDMIQALSCCGCFIVIDEEQEIVHFTPPSIQQYLLLDASDPFLAEYHVDLAVAEKQAGVACTAYLNFAVFDRRVARAPAQGTKILDIPTAVTQAMMPNSRLATKLAAISLLTNKETQKKLNRAIQRQFENAARQVSMQTFFLPYASKWWIWHTKRLDYKEKRTWGMWCRLLTDEASPAEKIWEPKEWSGYGLNKKMLQWATRNDHNALIEYMILTEKSIDPAKSSIVNEMLVAKARDGQWSFLCEVLGNLSVHQGFDASRTLLLVPAAWHDKLDIIQFCVTDGADLCKTHQQSALPALGLNLEAPAFPTPVLNNLRLRRGQYMLDWWSPLGIATAAGHTRVVNYITSMPYDPQCFTEPSSLPQALLVSAAYGHSDICQELLNLEHKQRVYTSQDDDIGNDIYIKRQWDVNLRDENGWTPLMYAVAFLNLRAIGLLLDHRATYDSNNTITPLDVASLAGREDIRRFLISSAKYRTNQRPLKSSVGRIVPLDQSFFPISQDGSYALAAAAARKQIFLLQRSLYHDD